MDIERWMFVHYRDSEAWVLPVWSAANNAATEGRIDPLPHAVTGLGLHIATRQSMLTHLIGRMNKYIRDLAPLLEQRKPHHEFTSSTTGYVFEGIPDDLKFHLLLDIDSLLFELDSCWDFMKKVVTGVYNHLRQPLKDNSVATTVALILTGAGQDQTWFQTMNRYRNIFTHEAAPYFAIDLTGAGLDPPQYDLLIMRDNLDGFDDDRQFLRLQQLQRVVADFFQAQVILRGHLIQLLNDAGRA